MAIPIPLHEALEDSITSGTFVDTKFWVFSKCNSRAGRVGEPKALFMNGHVGRSVLRLGSLLDETETEVDLRARFPTDRKPFTSDYDYEDDSDLEEDYDNDIPEDELESVAQAATEKPGNNPDIVVIENSDTKSNESSDVVSISDVDSFFSESSDTKVESGTTTSAHVGRVVVIEDVAFVTFQALLRYLYTGEIEFAPWGSTERREDRANEEISEPYGIPKPSPKSVYRLADKYDIPELKELALRQIQQDLSKCDITEEVFSKYTSWYPELRELELRQLARALLSSDSGPTLRLLEAKIKSYAHGKLSHAEHILPAFYELMESDDLVKETPLLTTASADHQVTGGDWDGLKKALTSSLTSGTFLDSQFYAVESRLPTGSLEILPMYFCSGVGGSFVSKLVAYSSKLRPRRTSRGMPLPRREDGYDSDIDDKDPVPEGITGCYPRLKCVQENPAAANLPMEPSRLLDSGAVKTWSAIFLFVYTGRITFAALCSKDATPSEKEAQDGCFQGEEEPPHDSGRVNIMIEPCSPKSVYCLANRVGLVRLCDIAFKDIQSKLDENNIVQELFSPFTANHWRIRKMEHELFQSKLKPHVDGSLLSDIIRSSSSGENSHRMAAMTLILERSIHARRERMLKKVKDSPRPDPAPQPVKTCEAPNNSTPRVQPPAPVTLQPTSQSVPNAAARMVPNVAPVCAEQEASQTSSTPVKPAKRSKVVQREESQADIKVKAPPPKIVELGCWDCNVKHLRSDLRSGVCCPLCSRLVKCVGCKTRRSDDVEICTGCHGRFK